jgi:type I restriction enzyme S subunit
MAAVEQKANVPALRFPEFAGEWTGEVLGNNFTFKNGVNADKSAYGSGTKFINVLDIICDQPLRNADVLGSVTISESQVDAFEVRYGDVLFQRSSETREESGQSNIYIDNETPAVFGGFVIRGRPIKKQEPLFFHYMLKTASVRREITSRSGGSTRYNVGQETLAEVNVQVPNLPEQKKVAAFLGAVDEKIAQLKEKKSLLEAYKKGCMQQIFSQQIRFKRDDGENFPDWKEKRLGELVSISTGTSNREDSHLIGAYTFFDRSNDFRRSDKFLFDCEALIVAGEGKDFPPRYFNGKFDLHQRAYAITDFGTNSAQFLHKWIIHNRHHFLRRSVGSTMPSLRMNAFTEFPVNVPHSDEQCKIADFLSAIDTKIDLATQEIDSAQTFKKGLLQQMFV